MPGTYNLTASFDGYEPATAVVVVPESLDGVIQDFHLRRIEELEHQHHSKATRALDDLTPDSFGKGQQH